MLALVWGSTAVAISGGWKTGLGVKAMEVGEKPGVGDNPGGVGHTSGGAQMEARL